MTGRYLQLVTDYDTHPKLLALTEVQRWRWTRLLLACVRHNRDVVTSGQLADLGLLTALDRLIELDLLAPASGDAWRVHDVMAHNAPSVDKRVDAYLATHPRASANEVHSVVGGRKQAVLAAVHRYRGTTPVPAREPQALEANGSTEPGGVVPRARTRVHAASASASASASENPLPPTRSAVRRAGGLTDISEEIERLRPDRGGDA